MNTYLLYIIGKLENNRLYLHEKRSGHIHWNHNDVCAKQYKTHNGAVNKRMKLLDKVQNIYIEERIKL